MNDTLSWVLLIVGSVLIGFSRRIAQQRVSQRYPAEKLRFMSESVQRRARRATTIATVVSVLIGAI